jgi:hypothetical protein
VGCVMGRCVEDLDRVCQALYHMHCGLPCCCELLWLSWSWLLSSGAVTVVSGPIGVHPRIKLIYDPYDPFVGFQSGHRR